MALSIEPSLEDALAAGWTIPTSWYVDPEVFERERTAIFERSWQYVGKADELARPGDYLTARVGRVPVVVVRNGSGDLAGFVNVCLHRCAEVVRGAGHRSTLQCHYHAWTYGLDGRLLSAPRSEREACFSTSDYRLEPIQVGQYGPFVFVNLSSAAPSFEDSLGELPDRLADGGLDLDGLVAVERSEWEVAANWKVVVENYDECYHCPVAHPSFTRLMEVDPDRYALEAGSWWSRASTPLRSWPEGRAVELPYDPTGEVTVGQFGYLWPNFTLVQNPGPPNAMAFYFVPLAPERTLVVSEYLFAPGTPPGLVRDMIEFNLAVGAEDQALVESVQRGAASGRVGNGRLLLDSERLIQHFHALVAGALAESDQA